MCKVVFFLFVCNSSYDCGKFKIKKCSEEITKCEYIWSDEEIVRLSLTSNLSNINTAVRKWFQR